ncbi:MAG: DEAD/DEAH box helicase [Cytophagales bacterium]
MLFSDLNLNPPLLKALNELGFTQPTSIQSKVFSVVMSGKDVLGIAQTGTGKTFAYLLPCLRQLNFTKDVHPQVLIIVPTRELVVQIVAEIEKLTPYMNVVSAGVYGGVNLKTHIEVVHKGMDILVATPGRFLDLATNGILKMKSIKKLVIDEVDEMLNLGFRSQLTHIFDLLPAKRQNLLFSATLTAEVSQLIDHYFKEPVQIEAAPAGTPLSKIKQKAYLLPNFNTKVNLLEYLLLKDEEMKKVLVFASTKQLADQLFDKLGEKLPNQLEIIHSNKSQNYRFNAVNAFKSGSCRILIATDIVARGIDIAEVSHVINFDIPEEPENYIHRIGRTGRADKHGISITLFTKRELVFKAQIEELMQKKIRKTALPIDLAISDVLTFDEMPKQVVKFIEQKANKEESGPSFHEKSAKNKKVNNKIRRVEAMQIKYKKPKTRGHKHKGSGK